MTTITKEVRFEAGHRLMNHDAKCWNLHGHNYRVVVHLTAEQIHPETGMVMDFSHIKSRVKTWLDEKWDHGMVLNEQDGDTVNFCRNHQYKVATVPGEPTAEFMAEYLYKEFCHLWGWDRGAVKLTAVEVHETPGSSAIYRPS